MGGHRLQNGCFNQSKDLIFRSCLKSPAYDRKL